MKEYINGDESIISLSPEFANIVTVEIITETETEEIKTGPYTEDYHLEDAIPEIKDAYRTLHDELTKQIKEIKFNPQRYYISLRKKRNFAFIEVRKKKMTIVAMLDKVAIESKIKHHKIVTLADSFQKFYNGPCAQIVIADNSNMNEIINLPMEIQK